MDKLIAGALLICIVIGLIIYAVPAILILILTIALIYWCIEKFNNTQKQIDIKNKIQNGSEIPETLVGRTTSKSEYNIYNDFDDNDVFLGIESEYNNYNIQTHTTDKLEKVNNDNSSYDTEDLRVLRNELNKIELDMLSEEEIIDELINIEMKFSDIEILEDLNNQLIQMSREEMLSAIKNLRNLLNNTDLINQKKISAMDLIYNRYPNKQFKVKSKDISTKDFYLNDTAEDFKYKNDRLIKKRKLAEQLENEYKFERSFNPDIDESEFLYSQYTDEEEYLDAKIEELQKKNLAYDCYLTPEEENIYREDF